MLINHRLMLDFEPVSSQQWSWDEAYPGARAGLPGHSRVDAAEPSRFVSLRNPSCAFVDHSFFLLFQAFDRHAKQLKQTGFSLV